MSGPSALRLPGAGAGVWLSNDAAALALFFFDAWVRSEAARNGVDPRSGLSPAMRELRAALAAPTSAVGHADVRKMLDRPVSAQTTRPDDLVGMKEAARLLGDITERHARRLAVDHDAFGHVHRAGRSILVRRAEVEAYRASRARSAA